MSRSRIWTYLRIAVLSVVIQLVAIVLGGVSAGAGHGSYFVAKLLFPYTLLAGGMEGPIPESFVTLAGIQYLLYGFVWAMAVKYKRVAPVIIALVLVHFSAVVVEFTVFSQTVFGHPYR
ncbi:MAG TPA: hypothetical protein VKC56_07535 [Gallionellaceae bacterium]|nr:hypothetical protein [Gallionellaceae bacterium]